MGRIILGTCLAERYCLIQVFTAVTNPGVNLLPGATFKNKTTLSSVPSCFVWDTHTLSCTSLNVSTEIAKEIYSAFEFL